MYSKWIRKHNFDRYCERYMVTCFELMDAEGYGCGEYEIDIRSWHEDLYSKRYKVADTFSEHNIDNMSNNRLNCELCTVNYAL